VSPTKDNYWEKAPLFRSSAPRKDNSWKKAQRFRSGTVEERELLKKPAQDAAIETENVLRKGAILET